MAETAPQLPSELPVLPLRRTVAFPLTLQPLAVNRPVSIETVNRALGARSPGPPACCRTTTNDDPGPDDLLQGRHGRRHPPDGQGRRAASTSSSRGSPRVRADAGHAHGHDRCGRRSRRCRRPFERTIEVEAHIRRIQELIEKALSLSTGLSEELRGVVMNIDDPLRLAYVLATLIDMKPADKQALLEENDLLKKLEIVAAALTREVSLLEAERQDRVAGAAGDDRRAASVLPAPAAQGDPAGARRRRRQRARRAAQARSRTPSCPRRVNAVAMREVDRLARMTAASPEYQMLRTYIDWLLDVPWAVTTAGSPRSGRGAARARRGSLRPRQGQGTHRRVPRRSAS